MIWTQNYVAVIVIITFNNDIFMIIFLNNFFLFCDNNIILFKCSGDREVEYKMIKI